MSETVVEVSQQSWLSRVFGSLMGMVFGLILFIVAFVILWNNEGRTDMSQIAAESVPVNAASIEASAEGKLVALAGTLTSEEQLADPGYLAAGDYLTLRREVEMYAWLEKTDVETEKNRGGSQTNTTEYYYETGWTSHPRASNSFTREASRRARRSLSSIWRLFAASSSVTVKCGMFVFASRPSGQFPAA